MGTIRAVTRQLDLVAIMPLAVAAVVLVAALAGLGLGPLAFVAVVAGLIVTEATVEIAMDPPRQAENGA